MQGRLCQEAVCAVSCHLLLSAATSVTCRESPRFERATHFRDLHLTARTCVRVNGTCTPCTGLPDWQGSFCPGNSSLQELCPAGFFCHTPGQQALCPSGSVCPPGSRQPTECVLSFLCASRGLEKEQHVGWLMTLGVALMAVTWAVVAACCTSSITRKELRRQRSMMDALEVVRRRRMNSSYRRPDRSSFVWGEERSLASTASMGSMPGAELEWRVERPVHLVIRDLSLRLRSSGQTILDRVNVTLRPGLTAVMGASGAGKTSLLSAIRGATPHAHVEGEMELNGRVVKNIEGVQALMGYAPQDDIMLEDLSVHQVLLSAAKLFNRHSRPGQPKLRHIVDQVMTILDINHIRTSVIGSPLKRGISGGQRKRVSIGMEVCSVCGV